MMVSSGEANRFQPVLQSADAPGIAETIRFRNPGNRGGGRVLTGSPLLGGARWRGDEIGRTGPYLGSKRPGYGVRRNRFWLYREGLYRPDAPPTWFLHGIFE